VTNRRPDDAAPLAGITVVDVSRMLPGALLARTLADLGARVIKVEAPGIGDLMRHAPPLVDGVGAGFRALLRGCESVELDLGAERGVEVLLAMAARADVLVESFRPGTMERWGAGVASLRERNPRLVVCSLTGFGSAGARARQAAHDLNFAALSGLLERLGGGVPRVQLADVAAGMLAAAAVMAALYRRERTGRGAHVEQPLAQAVLPFLLWAWADDAGGAAGLGTGDTILAGRCPAYRLYRCSDGQEVAVAAVEPKFWAELAQALGIPQHALAGLDCGAAGAAAAAAAEAAFSARPRGEWLALLAPLGLPVTPVNDLRAARHDPLYRDAGWVEGLAVAGRSEPVPGPFLPSLGRTPERPAPRLGEHTVAVLEELGLR
jgi:crotonobetainyl-CoA:carnitine CoA-transferase CaiB-like acyl-CoA transferase